MAFAQYDHVNEQLATNRSHEAFRGPVLPGTLQWRSLGMDSESRDRAGDNSAWIFRARQPFSVAIWEIKAFVSSGIGGRPGPGLEIHRQ